MVESRHSKQEAAVQRARELAMETAPSQLVVYGTDGHVTWAVVFSGNEARNGARDDAPRPRSEPAVEPLHAEHVRGSGALGSS